MALINCPECGKEISDKSFNCINCGFPLSEIVNAEVKKESTYKWRCSKCGNIITSEPCEFCEGINDVGENKTFYSKSDFEEIKSNREIDNHISQGNEIINKTPEFVKNDKRKLRILLITLILTFAIIIVVAVTLNNKSNNNSLVGNWQLTNNSSITFYGDGTALWKSDVGNKTFEWQTNGSTMTWYFNGSPFNYSYEIVGDSLYVDGEYYAMRE